MQQVNIGNKYFDADLKLLKLAINELFIIRIAVKCCVNTPIHSAASLVLDDQVISGIIYNIAWSIGNNNLSTFCLTPRIKLLEVEYLDASVQIDLANFKLHINKILQCCGYSLGQIRWRGEDSQQRRPIIHFATESMLNGFKRILKHHAYNFMFSSENNTEIIILFGTNYAACSMEDSIDWQTNTLSVNYQQYRVMSARIPNINVLMTQHEQLIAQELFCKNNSYWVNYADNIKPISASENFTKPTSAFIHSVCAEGYLIYFCNRNQLLNAIICQQLKNTNQEISFQLHPGSKVLVDYIEQQPVIIKCIYSGKKTKNLELQCNKNISLCNIIGDSIKYSTGKSCISFSTQTPVIKSTTKSISEHCTTTSTNTDSAIIYSKTLLANSKQIKISCSKSKLEAKKITTLQQQQQLQAKYAHIEIDKFIGLHNRTKISSSTLTLTGDSAINTDTGSINCDYMLVQTAGGGFELLKSGIINFFGNSIAGSIIINAAVNKSAPGAMHCSPKTVQPIPPKQPVLLAQRLKNNNKTNSGATRTLSIKFSTNNSIYSEINLIDSNRQLHSGISDKNKYLWHNIALGTAQLQIKHNNKTICLSNSQHRRPLHLQPIDICNKNQSAEFFSLSAPIIIDIRQPASKAVLRDWQLKQLNKNVCIFIHGFNIAAGEFGEEFNAVKTQNGVATPILTGFKATILRDIKELASYYSFSESITTDPNLNPSANLNGFGACNWLLHMENNLNVAAGFDGKDYSNYKRIIFISWPSIANSPTDYQEIAGHTTVIAKKLITLIQQLKQHAKSINILAHSLGCGLCCKLLNMLGSSNLRASINKVFLFDAAVPNNIFNSKQATNNANWFLPNILNAAKQITILHSVNDNILGPIDPKKILPKHDWQEELLSEIISKLNAYSIYGLSNWLNCDIKDIFNYNQQSKIYKIWRSKFNPNLPLTLDLYIRQHIYILESDNASRKLASAKSFMENFSKNLGPNYYNDGLKIKIDTTSNRSFAIIERAYFLLNILINYSTFQPVPALGYSGIDSTDTAVKRAIVCGKLQSWNCDSIICSHSAIKIPNSALKELYKKIAQDIDF